MATGDAAGAAGLKVYDDTLLVTDIDTALNQRGDDIAAVMNRTTALEKVAKGTPKFIVNRSANGQMVPGNQWTQFTAGAWAPPTKSVGGFQWSGGTLRIPRPGIYELEAHAMFRDNDYASAGVQITRNTTDYDTTGTVAANETSIPAPDSGAGVHLGVTASRHVSLNANDVLRVFGMQRSRGQEAVNVGRFIFDLTFSAIWVDEQ